MARSENTNSTRGKPTPFPLRLSINRKAHASRLARPWQSQGCFRANEARQAADERSGSGGCVTAFSTACRI